NADRCCVPDYGLLALALQWESGVGPADAFTVHGLWPNRCDGSSAPDDGCDTKRKYRDVGSIIQAKDGALYAQMNEFWPSNSGKNTNFWQVHASATHEWGKHGTCLLTLAPSCYGSTYSANQEMLDYFSQTLALRRQYNLYRAFTDAGLRPGDRATNERFNAAAVKALGRGVTLRCNNGQISEVLLYFTVRGHEYTLVDPPRSGNRGCNGQVLWATK
ncbi:ribonuclease T2-like protein, partial [Thamnocephalis sphaerospora]